MHIVCDSLEIFYESLLLNKENQDNEAHALG